MDKTKRKIKALDLENKILHMLIQQDTTLDVGLSVLVSVAIQAAVGAGIPKDEFMSVVDALWDDEEDGDTTGGLTQ